MKSRPRPEVTTTAVELRIDPETGMAAPVTDAAEAEEKVEELSGVRVAGVAVEQLVLNLTPNTLEAEAKYALVLANGTKVPVQHPLQLDGELQMELFDIVQRCAQDISRRLYAEEPRNVTGSTHKAST